MDEMNRMLAEHACTKLTYLYANRIDLYDYDGFMHLWAADASIDMLGTVFSGHAGIRRFLEGREREMICRHIVTNNVVDVIDATRAKGYCYSVAWRAQNMLGKAPAPIEEIRFIVEYHDEFVRDPQRGWLFQHRKVGAAFRNFD